MAVVVILLVFLVAIIARRVGALVDEVETLRADMLKLEALVGERLDTIGNKVDEATNGVKQLLPDLTPSGGRPH